MTFEAIVRVRLPIGSCAIQAPEEARLRKGAGRLVLRRRCLSSLRRCSGCAGADPGSRQVGEQHFREVPHSRVGLVVFSRRTAEPPNRRVGTELNRSQPRKMASQPASAKPRARCRGRRRRSWASQARASPIPRGGNDLPQTPLSPPPQPLSACTVYGCVYTTNRPGLILARPPTERRSGLENFEAQISREAHHIGHSSAVASLAARLSRAATNGMLNLPSGSSTIYGRTFECRWNSAPESLCGKSMVLRCSKP